MSKLIEYHIILQESTVTVNERSEYEVDDSIHVYVERTVTTSDNIIESRDTIEEYDFSHL